MAGGLNSMLRHPAKVNQEGSIMREGVVDSDAEAVAAFVRSQAPGVCVSALRLNGRRPGCGPNSSGWV